MSASERQSNITSHPRFRRLARTEMRMPPIGRLREPHIPRRFVKARGRPSLGLVVSDSHFPWRFVVKKAASDLAGMLRKLNP